MIRSSNFVPLLAKTREMCAKIIRDETLENELPDSCPLPVLTFLLFSLFMPQVALVNITQNAHPFERKGCGYSEQFGWYYAVLPTGKNRL